MLEAPIYVTYTNHPWSISDPNTIPIETHSRSIREEEAGQQKYNIGLSFRRGKADLSPVLPIPSVSYQSHSVG